MIKFKFLSILAVMVLSTGCAFTVHDLPVNYQYKNTISVPDDGNLPQISISEIEDVRTVENPRMIMNQQNGYGQTTTGGWQAEKELALIVKDAISGGLESANLTLPSDRKIQLNGQLVDVTSNIVSGWTSGTINMKVSAKLTARDQENNQILWRDTVFGDGSSGKHSSIKTALVEAFTNSLNDLVESFLQDEYFQQQVLK